MTPQPLQSIADISNDWLTAALNGSTSSLGTALSFTLENDLDTSDGYLSNIYAIDVVTSNDKLSLVIKLLPEDKNVKIMAKELSVAVRENKFYKFILKGSFQEISTRSLPIPKVFYSENDDDAFTLLMENLIRKGYKSVNSPDGIDIHMTKATFKSIAIIHAFGYRYKEVHGTNSLQEFRIRLSNLEDVMDDDIKNGLNMCLELLKSGSLYEKLKKFNENKGHRHLRADNYTSTEVLPLTLIHGDLWSGQTMCNEGNEVCIFDWQFVNYSNPTDDLTSYIMLSCRKDVLNNLEEVLNVYTSALNENLTLLKSDYRFTREGINKSFNVSLGRGLWILLCSIEPFLKNNKISTERLLQIIQFADSLHYFSKAD